MISHEPYSAMVQSSCSHHGQAVAVPSSGCSHHGLTWAGSGCSQHRLTWDEAKEVLSAGSWPMAPWQLRTPPGGFSALLHNVCSPEWDPAHPCWDVGTWDHCKSRTTSNKITQNPFPLHAVVCRQQSNARRSRRLVWGWVVCAR